MTVQIGGDVAIQAPTVAQLRLAGSSLTIRGVSPQELASRAFIVTLPCDASLSEEVGDARLVLVNSASQAVLAQSGQLTVLAAGPDCVL
jgi:hypothetical protein